jgi:hypothetical protein
MPVTVFAVGIGFGTEDFKLTTLINMLVRFQFAGGGVGVGFWCRVPGLRLGHKITPPPPTHTCTHAHAHARTHTVPYPSLSIRWINFLDPTAFL